MCIKQVLDRGYRKITFELSEVHIAADRVTPTQNKWSKSDVNNDIMCFLYYVYYCHMHYHDEIWMHIIIYVLY